MGFGLILLLILYVIWDVNYALRFLFTVAAGRLFQRKRKINESTTIYGMGKCYTYSFRKSTVHSECCVIFRIIKYSDFLFSSQLFITFILTVIVVVVFIYIIFCLFDCHIK